MVSPRSCGRLPIDGELRIVERIEDAFDGNESLGHIVRQETDGAGDLGSALRPEFTHLLEELCERRFATNDARDAGSLVG